MKSHIRTAPGRLLIYGTDSEKTAKLRQICHELGMQAAILSQNHLNDNVGSLADRRLENFPGNDTQADDRECVIFCEFPEKSLDKALGSIRENIPGGIALKAVLTPSNRKMILKQLIAELEKEHDRLQGK